MTHLVPQGHPQSLEYKLGRANLEGLPRPVYCPVNIFELEQSLQVLSRLAQVACQKAVRGLSREGLNLEEELESLGRLILPPEGFPQILPDDVQPWFEVNQGLVAQIPWEAVPWHSARCLNPKCSLKGSPRPPSLVQTFCGACREPLTTIRSHLAGARHVSFVVHQSASAPPTPGKEFLIVADPGRELEEPGRDPDSLCRGHLLDVQSRLKKQGFKVIWLAGPMATRARVKEALRRPSVIGFYFFGHGRRPEGAREVGLQLADQLLFSRDIQDGHASVQFAFLNACHSGHTAASDVGSGELGGIAYELARGGADRVVIAPQWPVFSEYAARFADRFFRLAIRGWPFALAVAAGRKQSRRHYQQGKPDLSWAAYRCFGLPDRVLHLPATQPVAAVASPTPLFPDDGGFDRTLFDFAIDQVLLRACKRRNLQRRDHITPGDFLCGLVRRGELTRYALRQHGRNPDTIYEELSRRPETAPGEVVIETRPPAAEWSVTRRDQLHSRLIQLLKAAERLSCQTGDARIVSERDVIQAFLDTGEWEAMRP